MSVKWGPIGAQIFERTYSRIKEDGSKEKWNETVERVIKGNLSFVDKKFNEPKEYEKLYDLIYNFKAIPAGRHLWVSGVKGKEFIFNCHSAHWTDNPIDHFYFTFDELMKGGGVGTNYSNEFIKRYPKVQNQVDVQVVCSKEHPDYKDMKDKLSKDFSQEWSGCFRVEDSRKGWVESFSHLFRTFFNGEEIKQLVFDVSLVRPKGSPLRGFGGKASGPSILVDLFLNTSKLLNSRFNMKLNSIDYMLLDHYISTCVVAGGIRRSARMSLKHWADEDIFEFIYCKTKSRDHWTTNISVIVDNAFFRALKKKDKNAKRIYYEMVKAYLTNGEPGFVNSSKSEEGECGRKFISTNPCAEIHFTLNENDPEDTGFDVCNLGHINLSSFSDSPEDAKEAFRLMTRFLIRATFGNIENPLQQKVVKINRRIGVGIFGFQSWLNKMGIKFSECYKHSKVRGLLKSYYDVVRKESRHYAFSLRIPEPIKVTCVAPTGTIAQLPGETTGIQPIFSSYYIRRVRYHDTADELKNLKKEGFKIEKDIYSANTSVVEFHCKDKLLEEVERLYGAEEAKEIVEGQADVELSDFLAVQEMVQECFVDNAISFTINIEANEDCFVIKNQGKSNVMFIPTEEYIKEVMGTLIHYLPKLKGTTIMVNGSRPQAPYELITEEEYLKATHKRIEVSESDCKDGICPIK